MECNYFLKKQKQKSKNKKTTTMFLLTLKGSTLN